MPGYKIILLAIFFFSTSVGAQSPQGQVMIDSLKNLLSLAKDDSTELSILNKLAFQYYTINPTEGIRLAEEALEKIGEKPYLFEKSEAYNALGASYYSLGDFGRALHYFNRSITIARELGDKRSEAEKLGNTALIYTSIKNYNKAKQYLENALIIDEELGNKLGISLRVLNLANVHAYQENNDEAITLYLRALDQFRDQDHKLGMSTALGNLGRLFVEIGDLIKGEEYLNEAMKIDEEIENKGGIGRHLSNYAMIHYHRALELKSNSSNKTTIDYRSSLLKKSRSLLDTAATLTIEVEDISTLSNIRLSQSLVWEESGQFRDALKYYKEYAELQDSILSLEKSSEINFLTSEMELSVLEERAALVQEKLMREKQNKNYLLIGLFASLVAGTFVFYQYKRTQKAREIAEFERKRSDDLLLNILPNDVAQELKISGKSDARLYNNVTVMFTDFVNFTGISADIEPQVLVDELNRCFKAFDLIIEKHGLEKIKTIGDAYLAVSGLPAANEHHAIKAAEAALEIRDFVDNLKQHNGLFDVRIGLHSGSVVAGIVGIKKFAYDIWGDTVNTAARMEQNAQVGKINISGETHVLVKNHFDCEYRGKLDAKNKGHVDMYFLIAPFA